MNGMLITVMEGVAIPAEFSAIVSEVWSQITSCMSTIQGNVLLLAPIAIGFVGAIIGLAKRFLRFGSGRRR